MSYRRSTVRYNCFCMKRGIPAPDSNIVKIIEDQFTIEEWAGFAEAWDVIVTGAKITIVQNVKDINKVVEVCMYAHIAAKSGLELSPASDEDSAIIHMIESQFLDGKMTWENYRSVWSIRWDDERNRIETYLLRTPRTQTPVTQEMIDRVLQRGIAATQAMYASVDTALTNKEEK